MSTQRDRSGVPEPPESEPGSGWAAPDTPGTPTRRPPVPPAGPRSPAGAADFGNVRPPPIPTGEWVTTTSTGGVWDTLGGGRLPSSRPTYREPHPVQLSAAALGAAIAAAWFLLAGMMSWNVRSYAWATIIAGGLAWLTALVLARYGDRGVAVGVAGVAGVALAVVGLVVAVPVFDSEWILW